jgi:hypothetical protein
MNRPTVSCTCNGTCHPEPVNENHALCECGHTRSSHKCVSGGMRAPQFGVCMKLDNDGRFCGCSEYRQEKT